jgi:hypothetical protein
MGSVSLSLQKKVTLLALSLLSTGVFAKDFAEIKIPDTFKCGDKELPLQSAALRTFTWLKVRVYVVALYAEHRFTGMNDPKIGDRPVCYELTFLRDVDNEDTDKAWEAQFNDSSEYPYPELPAHIQYLKDHYGAIHGSRKHVFALLKGKSEIWENGVKRGEIEGDAFQKNFLSIWYGKKPPSDSVKEGLIKGF